MRRFFVIWLILLFPLNVFALSMSVASLQQPDAQEIVQPAPTAAESFFSSIFDGQVGGDLDSDEPPAVADLHDTVNEEDKPQPLASPRAVLSSHVLLRHSQSAFPPLKPPPTLLSTR